MHATSASIVYVFGIGDLLGRKLGQVTTHAQSKWRTVLLRVIDMLLGARRARLNRSTHHHIA